MRRQAAIEKLSTVLLEKLSTDERLEQLEIMQREDWSSDKEWKKLKRKVRKEIKKGLFMNDPLAKKYDDVLLVWLKDSLRAVSNEYLKNELNISEVFGEPDGLQSCPCCGSRTIEVRAEYDICKVCWWEDDGQDNENASEVYGGPNYGISLDRGRLNFIKHGIYDPKREDLFKLKEEKEKYLSGREFLIVEDKYLVEKGTDWKVLIDDILIDEEE